LLWCSCTTATQSSSAAHLLPNKRKLTPTPPPPAQPHPSPPPPPLSHYSYAVYGPDGPATSAAKHFCSSCAFVDPIAFPIIIHRQPQSHAIPLRPPHRTHTQRCSGTTSARYATRGCRRPSACCSPRRIGTRGGLTKIFR
jgi:hypothetical protein